MVKNLMREQSELSELFNGKGRLLYHFTTLEAACKIIASNKLLFNDLSDMNDIYESCRSFYGDNDAIKEELKSVKQISLTQENKNGSAKGFTIAPMWGHYGEKGKGVCITLRRDSIIAGIEANKKEMYGHDVTYKKNYDESIKIDTNKKLWKNRKSIFYLKDEKWNYEQEYRIITPIRDKKSAIKVGNLANIL